MNRFFVLSRYKEDVSWILDYTKEDYIIYNKGETIPDFNERLLPNYGGNQHDIFKFAHDNYENLPEFTVFVQAFPWDHCERELFDKLIQNTSLTALETPRPPGEPGTGGGYIEYNCGNDPNGYLASTMRSHQWGCRWHSFDQFMGTIFSNYHREHWCRFPPGSQFMVPKKNFLAYSKKFWGHLTTCMDHTIGKNGGAEAHVIERGMTTILSNIFIPVEGLR